MIIILTNTIYNAGRSSQGFVAHFSTRPSQGRMREALGLTSQSEDLHDPAEGRTQREISFGVSTSSHIRET